MIKIEITCKTGELIEIAKLERFQGDLKDITPEAMDKLKASIVKYGFSFPIFVWQTKILDGHQRLEAAKQLIKDGYMLKGGKLPVVQIEADSDQEAAEKLLLINSRYAQITQAGFDAFVTDFNIDLSDFSGLLEIPEIDFDFNGGGGFDGNTDPDEVPDVQPDIVSKRGDIWILGEHRLMCGDSGNTDNIRCLMKHNVWDVIIFDPPFEIENVYDLLPKSTPGKIAVIFWDMFRFQQAAIAAHNRQWVANYELIWDCVTSWYYPNRPLARHKSCGIFGDDKSWNFENAIIEDGKIRTEKIVENERGRLDYKPLDGAVHLRTIESFPTTSESGGHSHSKPVKWIAAILNGLNNHEILDMFCGSGTTIIAAQKTNRRCYAMEISERYVDVAVRRWQAFTGQQAVLEPTGEKFDDIPARHPDNDK